MALTRKYLSALGIEGDKIDEIINAHAETVDGLKDEIAKYKADAEKLPGVQKELADMKTAAEKAGKDPYKVKYEAIKEEYDKYKADQTAKETKAAKSAAYKALLKDAGVAEKRIDAVLKVSDVEAVELDADGKIKDAGALKKSIREEWADFISKEQTVGAKTETPPPSSGGTVKSREDIYKTDDHGRFILNASERQAALAQLNASEH